MWVYDVIDLEITSSSTIYTDIPSEYFDFVRYDCTIRFGTVFIKTKNIIFFMRNNKNKNINLSKSSQNTCNKTETVTKTICICWVVWKTHSFTKHLACTNLTCAYFHLKYIWWFRNSVTATKQNQYYFVWIVKDFNIRLMDFWVACVWNG